MMNWGVERKKVYFHRIAIAETMPNTSNLAYKKVQIPNKFQIIYRGVVKCVDTQT